MLNILLVEDAPADAELLQAALEAGGARVVRAHSDLGVYQLLETEEPFDALVTDLNLGFGATGFEVATAARRIRPAIAVVYVTGERGATDGEEVEGAVFIRKSMRATETAAAVLSRLS